MCTSFLGPSPFNSGESLISNLQNGADQKMATECIYLASWTLSELGAGLLSQLSRIYGESLGFVKISTRWWIWWGLRRQGCGWDKGLQGLLLPCMRSREKRMARARPWPMAFQYARYTWKATAPSFLLSSCNRRPDVLSSASTPSFVFSGFRPDWAVAGRIKVRED